ncbi:cAMP-binding domain-containing protein [Listeria weihenstephanensis FSL R9-0317]|uniref:HTH crp-type domain-containing protein n=1 Tax=Listeria weihenstephanensis TaxID=1006155 RepID=A0A1S7FQR5_9LIST|nr:Crp/Fnr family transcriptional regulator [Listeria weihenstephanensis]AQY49732.1 hypothetical protein UE46_00735 [Listeria weihenstephanensis]EUJ41023.1 cAMP-binding domain-containing protein [Listeria weihenstephanensis FSL R9-0317]
MESPFMDLYGKETVKKNFSYSEFLKILLASGVPFVKQEIPNHQILLIENEPNKDVYFVEDGVILLNSNRNVVRIVGSKQIIGLNGDALVDESFYTATAISKVTAYIFSKKEVLQTLMSMQEGWLYIYLNNQENEKIMNRRYVLMRQNGEERLRDALNELAENYGISKGDYIYIPKIFTRKIIASYTNLSVKSLARIMKVLIEEGFLVYDSKQLLLSNE